VPARRDRCLTVALHAAQAAGDRRDLGGRGWAGHMGGDQQTPDASQQYGRELWLVRPARRLGRAALADRMPQAVPRRTRLVPRVLGQLTVPEAGGQHDHRQTDGGVFRVQPRQRGRDGRRLQPGRGHHWPGVRTAGQRLVPRRLQGARGPAVRRPLPTARFLRRARCCSPTILAAACGS
jgi:hypothetical protein